MLFFPSQAALQDAALGSFLPRMGTLAFLKRSSQSRQIQFTHWGGSQDALKGRDGEPASTFPLLQKQHQEASHTQIQMGWEHRVWSQPLWARILNQPLSSPANSGKLLSCSMTLVPFGKSRELHYLLQRIKRIWVHEKCLVCSKHTMNFSYFYYLPCDFWVSLEPVRAYFLIHRMGIKTCPESLSLLPLVTLITLVTMHPMFAHLSTQHMLAAGFSRVPST